MPALDQAAAKALIAQRHPEWVEFQKRWRWLQDSLEGGERYRHADYFRGPFDPTAAPWYAFGWDSATGAGYPFSYGQIVERNLIPHLSEMSVDGRDLYVLRLVRTPVPTLVRRVARRYLARIFAKQIKRTGPKPLEDWWADVNGKKTDATAWWRKTIDPLLLALGQIDLVFGHPETPEGVEVRTRADAHRLKLAGCVAGFILPENLVWWKLAADGSYAECLVHEGHAAGLGKDKDAPCWRHWTAEGSWCYTAEGKHCPDCSFAHPFGRVPILRIFDERKSRCGNVGQPRLEAAAELQRSVYNRSSELVLSDVTQSHALLQGPEEYCQQDAKVPIGPSGILPKKRSADGNSYEGFGYLDPPKSGAAECRTHIQDDVDQVYLDSALLKPAGLVEAKGAGSRGAAVAQSGISKLADQAEGNDVLAELAQTLGEAEEAAAGMALLVLTDGKASEADLEAVEVEYPSEFDLFSASDLGSALQDLQALAAVAGVLPESEGELLKRLITVCLPGLSEERLGELHAEVEAHVAAAAVQRGQDLEARNAPPPQSQAGDPAFGPSPASDPSLSLPRDAGAQVEALNRSILSDSS